MVLDIKNAHTLRSLNINMNRKSFLLFSLSLFTIQEPKITPKRLDPKDKPNFVNFYLHEFAHKLNQVRPNEFHRSI